MKITPLDIRQKTFERKTFGGYDREEVTAFLHSLSVAWERVMDENKELRIRLESTDRELAKLREVESSLYRTLKTAEDTSNHLIDQANRNAELSLRDAQLKAESLMKEAKWQAKNVIDDAEAEARKVYKSLYSEVKNMEQDYRQLENMRENLLADLRSLSKEIEDKVDRAAVKANKTMFLAPSPKPASPQLEAIKKSLAEPDLVNFKEEPDPATTLEPVTTPTGPLFQSSYEPEPEITEPEPEAVDTEPVRQAPAPPPELPDPETYRPSEPAFLKEDNAPNRRGQGSFFDQF